MDGESGGRLGGSAGHFLVWLGAARDGLIVAVGGLYILGFLVVSFHAWAEDLGLLPAIDAQYFVAGIGPALTLGLALLLREGIRKLGFHVTSAILKKAELWTRIGKRMNVILACAIAWFVVVMVVVAEPAESTLVHTSMFIVATVFILAVFVSDAVKGDKTTVMKAVFYYFGIGLLLAALVFYQFTLYPRIPQEIGGLKPRPAYLDINRDRTSSETFAMLTGLRTADLTKRTYRSKRVEVLFSGSSFLLVRPQGDVRLYEIGSDAVSTVIWAAEESGEKLWRKLRLLESQGDVAAKKLVDRIQQEAKAESLTPEKVIDKGVEAGSDLADEIRAVASEFRRIEESK